MTIELEVNQAQLKAISRSLRQLEPKLQKKIIREEARRAAKAHLLPQAKSAVPVDSGTYRKSIKVRAIKRSRKAVGVQVSAGVKGFTGDAFYGGFLEYGWRVGKRGNSDRRHVKGKGYLAGVAKSQGPKAANAAAKGIAARIDQELRK